MRSLLTLLRSKLTPKRNTEIQLPVVSTEPSVTEVLSQLGIKVSATFGAPPASQDIPVDHIATGTGRFYVYVHRDCNGRIFYVGKGTAKRAWSDERHPIWHHYVSTRSNGEYTVQVVSYHESNGDAENVEASYISRYGPRLVNWINTGRDFDYPALARFHAARNANRELIAETRKFESTDPQQAVERYRQAMIAMNEYLEIVHERGLVAELNAELFPSGGDDNILDRLTLCLFRLGRHDELNAAITEYQRRFPNDYQSDKMKSILKRQQRANKAKGE